jgi:hypothetical protein
VAGWQMAQGDVAKSVPSRPSGRSTSFTHLARFEVADITPVEPGSLVIQGGERKALVAYSKPVNVTAAVPGTEVRLSWLEVGHPSGASYTADSDRDSTICGAGMCRFHDSCEGEGVHGRSVHQLLPIALAISSAMSLVSRAPSGPNTPSRVERGWRL